jgi:phospholipid/cholesterol/gamma-HCH transport system substrate-binding protein
MNERAGYVTVGIFVLTAVTVTVGFVLFMSGGRSSESQAGYVIEFARDVTGLSVGSPVRYMGVDVGEVTDMDLITNRGTRVAVQIEVDASTPIHSGTYASLTYQGITGVAFINLATDPGEFSPLPVPDRSEAPRLPARDVGLPALLAQSGSITTKIDLVLDQAGDLLHIDNRESLSEALANLAILTEALADDRDTIAALPRQIADSLAELRGTARRVHALLDRSEPDLLAAIAQMNAATADAARITDRLGSWLDGNGDRIDVFVAGALVQVPELVAESRRSLRELDKLLMNLRDDPSQIIYRPRQNAERVEP